MKLPLDRRRFTRWGSFCALTIVVATASGSCGARSGLFALIERDAAEQADEGVIPSPLSDAATLDAHKDNDAGIVLTDAHVEDTGVDVAIEPLFPPIDAAPPQAAAKCAVGSTNSAYLISVDGNFYRFDPPTLTSTLLGRVNCETTPGASPFTMTVSENGATYVLYSTGILFRVDPTTFACTKTPFNPQTINSANNVGIATSRASGGERLYMYGTNGNSKALASCDLVTFTLSSIGLITPNPRTGFPLDIKGDAYGRLLGCDGDGTIIALDILSGRVYGEDLTGLSAGPANALLLWRNEIYIFTQAQGLIHKFDLQTKQVAALGAVGDTIAGAGAAPCIP